MQLTSLYKIWGRNLKHTSLLYNLLSVIYTNIIWVIVLPLQKIQASTVVWDQNQAKVENVMNIEIGIY